MFYLLWEKPLQGIRDSGHLLSSHFVTELRGDKHGHINIWTWDCFGRSSEVASLEHDSARRWKLGGSGGRKGIFLFVRITWQTGKKKGENNLTGREERNKSPTFINTTLLYSCCFLAHLEILLQQLFVAAHPVDVYKAMFFFFFWGDCPFVWIPNEVTFKKFCCCVTENVVFPLRLSTC
jgi:hypothetical protein